MGKISWHENGQKKLEGNFKEGKKHGVSVYYDKNGKEIVRQNWKHDVLVFQNKAP